MENLYYILTINKKDLPTMVSKMTNKVKNMFVEEINTVRWNNTNTKCVVKLRLGIKTPPKIIDHLTAFSNAKILTELNKKEWQSIEVLN